MTLQPPAVVGARTAPRRRRWNRRDTMLYAVGVGATEPAFTTENTEGVELRALPSMAALLAASPAMLRLVHPAARTRVLHAGCELQLIGVLPAAGTVSVIDEITSVVDKGPGRAAFVAVASTGTVDGAPVFRRLSTMAVPGGGGFGGENTAQQSDFGLPDRGPDDVSTEPTLPGQALLYRLSGDRNRLHSDPGYARQHGFPRPILHGMCTFGFAGRALQRSWCAADPTRVRRIAGRFIAPVLPGDELSTSSWLIGPGRVSFTTVATTKGGESRVAIDRGDFRFSRTGT